MECVSCNLCGADGAKLIYSMPDILYFPDERFNVVECQNCGLGYTNPRPTRQEIGRYYPSQFYDYFDDALHEQRYQAEAVYLADLCGAGRKLLDIGCANGDFPRFMRQLGWEISAVEISESARVITDFPVFRHDFSDIPLDEPTFDAITAWAVLEHTHNPRAYFEKAARVLKPGGRFVFLVTNFESWPSRYLYREDLPRHLYFFTETTVRHYLKLAGLSLHRRDFSNAIYALRPVNWLRYCIYRFLLRRHMRWVDLPERPLDYFQRHGGSDILTKIRYVIEHPFTIMDRILMPVFELVAPHRLTRGITVFVAIKPKSSND